MNPEPHMPKTDKPTPETTVHDETRAWFLYVLEACFKLAWIDAAKGWILRGYVKDLTFMLLDVRGRFGCRHEVLLQSEIEEHGPTDHTHLVHRLNHLFRTAAGKVRSEIQTQVRDERGVTCYRIQQLDMSKADPRHQTGPGYAGAEIDFDASGWLETRIGGLTVHRDRGLTYNGATVGDPIATARIEALERTVANVSAALTAIGSASAVPATPVKQ